MNKNGQDIPNWAEKERLSDMVWIGENAGLFRQAAYQQYQIRGRGAIVVDTTVQAVSGGHPFFYSTQDEIIKMGEGDAQRMVRQYDPNWEIVIMLLKPRDRVSVYRFMAI